jgi:hypothetical protein
MIQAPYPLAMVICDTTWIDPASGKRTILGCFDVIQARSFPAVYPIMGVFLSLTDGRDRTTISIRLVDAEEERDPLFLAETEVDFADPRQVVEFDFYFTGVVFPLPGEYRVQLFAADEPLLERRIVLIQTPGVPL